MKPKELSLEIIGKMGSLTSRYGRPVLSVSKHYIYLSKEILEFVRGDESAALFSYDGTDYYIAFPNGCNHTYKEYSMCKNGHSNGCKALRRPKHKKLEMLRNGYYYLDMPIFVDPYDWYKLISVE